MHNLVISNVPGPPLPLYFMGALIEALHPLGPVFHGAGLNITVMSNNGRVGVGVIACRESMPDVDDLAQRFPAELERLREAVEGREAVTPITKAKGTKARRKPDARARTPRGPMEAAQSSLVTVREVRPSDRSARVILVRSAGLTPLRTVTSTRPSSNSAAIWSACVPSGRVITRRNSP